MKLNKHISKVLLSASMLAQIACQGEYRTVILDIETIDVTKKPVPFVEIFINDKAVAITDENGKHKLNYEKAKIGENIRISFNPTMAGYHELYPQKRELLIEADSSMMAMLGKSDPLLVEIKEVTFERPKQPYLFVVEGEPNAEIFIENEPIADRIKEDGYAIILYEATPGKTFTIQAGKLAASGRFSEGQEIYVLTSQKQEAIVDSNLLSVANADSEVAQAEPNSAQVEPEVAKEEKMPEPAKEAVKPAMVAKLEPIQEEEENTTKPIKATKTTVMPKEEEEAPVLKPIKEKAMPIKVNSNIEDEPMPKATIPSMKSKKIEPVEEEESMIPPPSIGNQKSGNQKNQKATPVEDEEDFIPPPTTSKSTVLPLPKSQPEPEVEVKTTNTASNKSSGPSVQDLLKKNNKPTNTASSGTGPTEAPIEDEDIMASKNTKSSTPVMGSSASALDNVPKETVSAEVDRISENYGRTKVLRKQDIDYLKQVSTTHGSAYQEANRILGEYYFSIKETNQQIACLEIATKQGKYKKDPRVMLSLAQAYASIGKHQDGLDVMKKVEPMLNRLGAERANAHQTYAEMYKFAYMSVKSKNPRQANPVYLDNAIEQWKKYTQVGGDSGKAQKQIEQLESLKADAN